MDILNKMTLHGQKFRFSADPNREVYQIITKDEDGNTLLQRTRTTKGINYSINENPTSSGTFTQWGVNQNINFLGPNYLGQDSYEFEPRRYGIDDDKLKRQFHHAHHSWVSPDLTVIVNDSPAVANSWLGDTFQYLREQIQTINVLDALLAQSTEPDDYLVLKKVYEVAMSVLDKYPKQEAEMSDEWRNTIVTKKATKKTITQKKSSRKKMTKAQKRERSFAKKMRKIIAEAEALGITGDYAMAKHFSDKGYARKDGKRKWRSETVKKYRSKYALDKS